MGGATSYDELWGSTWGHIQHVGPVHRHMHERLVRLIGTLPVRSVLDVLFLNLFIS